MVVAAWTDGMAANPSETAAAKASVVNDFLNMGNVSDI
jgi:hypothetical protein